MFSRGNMNPLSIIVGRNMPMSDMSMATSCEAATVDISNPKERAQTVNNKLSATSKTKLPRIGTSNTK